MEFWHSEITCLKCGHKFPFRSFYGPTLNWGSRIFPSGTCFCCPKCNHSFSLKDAISARAVEPDLRQCFLWIALGIVVIAVLLYIF